MRSGRSLVGPPLLALLLAFVLAGCGGSVGSSSPAAAPTAAPASDMGGDAAQMDAPIPAAAAPTVLPAAEPSAAPAAGGGSPGQPVAPGVPANDPSRKIIKDATLVLEVAKVDLSLSRVNAIAAQAGGYILETRTDYLQELQKQAFVKLAVPVDQFEATLQRLREGVNRIISEQASGVDATQEFVDVQSQLANLEATQARIRQFLDQAKTTEEALQVNAQLTEIEGQIGMLKGRMQFLSQRAAYSTITVQLLEPPPPTPTFTPTPTLTPVPLWNPSRTAEQASGTLMTIVQAIGTVLIWCAIVVLPLGLPVALLLGLLRLRRRRPPPAAPRAGD